jgi:multiple sugar transport system substrate-binding protein
VNSGRSKKLQISAGAALAMALLLAACSGGNSAANSDKDTGTPGQQQEQQPEKKEPVTLNILFNGFSQERVNEVKKQVESKFPHITLNAMMESKGNYLADVVAAGLPLDAVARSAGGLFDAIRYGVVSDLTPYIEKHKFDLSRLAPGVLEAIKSYSGKNEILVMPYELNNTIVTYNKAIFDKFGVEYPWDGMTWDDMFNLAQKVTRQEGGVQYKGVKLNALNMVYRNQLGLTFVDQKTLAPTLNTDQWKRWIETMTKLYTIPGNQPASDDGFNFYNRFTLAMLIGPSPLDSLPAAVERGLDWDVVQLPHFPGMEDAGSQMNAPFYAMTPTTKHKDDVFQVLAHIVSDEVQTANSRMGRVSVLKSPEVMAEFGKDLDILKGKNVKAFYAEKIAKPIPITIYDGIARSQLSKVVDFLVGGPDDVNTALRKAEEETARLIAEEKK